MKVLTVAIPSYNMEKYLSRCLDSLSLDLLEDKIEVLVINDGSKDNTLNIAKEYELKYPDTIKVIDKENGGWGSAVNIAIKKATGKYFKILDSDDWFDSDSFIKLVDLLGTIDVDLVLTSFNNVYDNGKVKENIYDNSLCNKILKFEDYLITVNCHKYIPMASMTYKTAILSENRIQVVEKFYADIDFNLTPLMFVNTVYFSQLNVYQYYIGREGQSTSLDGYKRHLIDFINVAKKEISFFEKNEISMTDYVRKAYILDILNIIRFVYELLLSPIYESKEYNRKQLVKEFDSYLKNTSNSLYKESCNIKKKHIPYIWIWRTFGLNILNFRK